MVALNLDSLALSQDLKDMWVPYSKKALKVASKGAEHKSYLNFRVKAIEEYLTCNPFPRKSNLLNLSQLNNLMTKNSLRYFAVILILSMCDMSGSDSRRRVWVPGWSPVWASSDQRWWSGCQPPVILAMALPLATWPSTRMRPGREAAAA